MVPLQNQNVPPQGPRSSEELHDGIRAITHRITAAMSSFSPLNIASGSWCQLRDRAITLLPEKMAIRLDSRRILIRIILEMPPDERVDFARSILELIPQIDQDTKNAFIETVAANLGNDEGGLVRNILPFVTTEMYSSKNITITQMVANLPLKNEREGVVKNSQILITPEMSTDEIAVIIREVADTPANDREDVIRCSQMLITPFMSADKIAVIIRAVAVAVADIPADERETVTKISRLLIDPFMSADKIIAIIWLVANTPANDREDVIRCSQMLITPFMSADKIAVIIRAVAVADIPADERETVTKISRLLIDPFMSADKIIAIIWLVANTPANDREDVIRCSQMLITTEMSAAEVTLIIRAVSRIPANEREAVTRFSQQLITPEMSENTIVVIIQAIANIPANEREAVTRFSQQLITPEMSENTIVVIIQAIANIPANERARIIPRIAALPVNERQEAIRNAAFPLLRRGMNVHANDRDQRTKAAIELWLEHQKNITPLELNEAKDSFIAYLEKSPIDETKKTLAKRALLEPRKNNEDFGPLISDQRFSILGSPISGADLIGRLWIFISHLAEEEQANATTSMISALIDSYSEPDIRVCNQGKAQRLIVAVLQGRLAGVNIEGDVVSVSTSEAMRMFFNIEAHRKIDTLKDLMKAANQFCDDHTLVNRNSFILELKEYARQQEIKD